MKEKMLEDMKDVINFHVRNVQLEIEIDTVTVLDWLGNQESITARELLLRTEDHIARAGKEAQKEILKDVLSTITEEYLPDPNATPPPKPMPPKAIIEESESPITTTKVIISKKEDLSSEKIEHVKACIEAGHNNQETSRTTYVHEDIIQWIREGSK